jgi:tRNA-uridine aminocarboxypropyltransferase
LMLKNISTVYVGETGWEKDVGLEISRNDYTPVLLFPLPHSRDGQNIIEETGKPLNIFVLDTSWRNARRWLRKPMLIPLRKIGLMTAPSSVYYLRKQSAENYLCTFQAVTSLMADLGTKGYASSSFNIQEKFKLWVKSLARERGLILPQPHHAPQGREEG